MMRRLLASLFLLLALSHGHHAANAGVMTKESLVETGIEKKK